MIKACIFDVDGVLLDSVEYHFKAWKALFDSLAIPFTYDDYVQKVNGLPRSVGIKNIATSATDSECEKYASIKQEFLIDLVKKDPLKPLPGVVDFLTYLQEKEVPAAAASSSKNAPLFLAEAGLDRYLKAIVSGSDFKKPKPDPEIFLLAARRLGMKPSDCLVVEDALSGIRAANTGGMKSVGLLHSGDEAMRKEADICIHSLKEYSVIVDAFFS